MSRDYLHELGMPRECIFDGYDAIDNEHFARPDELAPQNVRSELGLRRPYFLASNRFIEKKNLPCLINAYEGYRKQGNRKQETGERGSGEDSVWDLVLLGDGPEKESLVRQVADLGLTDVVHFPGFRQYDELPKYYWGADAFLHASTTEQWGLVINEAMAAGLPVIASSRCGSTTDLVIDGETGFVFDPLDTETLTDRMIRIAGDESLRARMSVAATRHVAHWGPERFANGMKQAVDAAMSGAPRAGWMDRLILSLSCR